MTHVLDGRGVPVVETDSGDQARARSGVGHAPGLLGGHAHGLLDPEGLAGLDGRQGDLLVQVVGGADGDGLDLGIRQQFTVIGAGALKAEVLGGGSPRLLDRVRGDHQTRLSVQFGEALRDGPVTAGVESTHPSQGDDADADLLLGVHDGCSPDGRRWPT